VRKLGSFAKLISILIKIPIYFYKSSSLTSLAIKALKPSQKLSKKLHLIKQQITHHKTLE